MYEQFFGINKNPFSLTPDPRFLVMTNAHCEVKAALTYAIIAGKGFSVLTGDAGTGKTTLVRAVMNSVPNLCFSYLVNPVVTTDEFYEAVLADFGIAAGPTKPERLRKLLDFLIERRSQGGMGVLFVDEAHRLSIEMLEEIRLLTNLETEVSKLLHIILVGQDELDELLERRELRQLKQRVEVRQHIGRLHTEEIPIYVAHRWSCAGGMRMPFTAKAIDLIAVASSGVPRLINSICDNALLLAFADSTRIVAEEHVEQASRDLRLIAPGSNGSAMASRVPEKSGYGATNPTSAGGADPLDLRLPRPVRYGFPNEPLSLFAPPKRKRSSWRFWKIKPA